MPQRRPDGQNIIIDLSDNLDRRYEVRQKPNRSPFNTYNNRTINWVASFGFRPKPGSNIPPGRVGRDGFVTDDLEEPYTIKLEKTGEDLVYYDGSKIQLLTYTPDTAVKGDTVEAELKAADPPIGWM